MLYTFLLAVLPAALPSPPAPASRGCAPESCTGATIRVGGLDSTCRSIQAALDCIPNRTAAAPRIAVAVAPGVYRNQSLRVQRSKGRVSLVGDSPEPSDVVILGAGAAAECGGGDATVECGVLAVESDDFVLANLTLANAANASTMVPTIPAGKPFAIEIGGDRAAIYNSRLLGKDDSVFTGRHRVYLRNTTVSGSTDFNFGQGAAVYDRCTLVAEPGKFWSWITAHAGTPANGSVPRTAYLILDSRLPLVGVQRLGTTFLGRPWGAFAQVVYKNTWMDRHISPEGWTNSKGRLSMAHVYFAEFNSSGPGANPTKRKLSKQLSESEAAEWTVERVLGGWLPPAAPLLS